MYLWKQHIDSEIIDMFLDRIFQACGNSYFEFEEILKNFGSTNAIPLCECFCPRTEELNEEIEELEEEIKKWKSEAKEQGHNSKTNWKKLLSMRKKYEELKENSVVFSMDI